MILFIYLINFLSFQFRQTYLIYFFFILLCIYMIKEFIMCYKIQNIY